MKRGQTSVRGGYEDILFPMEVLNITQGDNVGTHRGTYATDNAGKDSGIDPLFAPVTMTLVDYDTTTNGNAVFFQSDKPVRFADGSIDYLTMLFIHDNYIEDIKQVKHFRQGQEFGDEGTAGKATGNHSHMEFAKGKYNHKYDKNQFGVYHLPNNMPIENACFMDSTEMRVGVANWRYTKDTTVTVPSNNTGKPDQILTNGSKVEFAKNLRVEKFNSQTGLIYNTRIGGWISPEICYEDSANDGKQDQYFANTNATFTIKGTYTVSQVNKAKNIVYLKELGFWVNAEPLTEVKEGN